MCNYTPPMNRGIVILKNIWSRWEMSSNNRPTIGNNNVYVGFCIDICLKNLNCSYTEPGNTPPDHYTELRHAAWTETLESPLFTGISPNIYAIVLSNNHIPLIRKYYFTPVSVTFPLPFTLAHARRLGMLTSSYTYVFQNCHPVVFIPVQNSFQSYCRTSTV